MYGYGLWHYFIYLEQIKVKKLLLLILLLLPNFTFAQSQRNPCYNPNSPNTNYENCVGVGVASPLPVQSSYLYANITTDATTVVKSGAGILHTICFNSPLTTEVTTVYDNTAASGTKISTITTAAASPVPVCVTYDVVFNTGLTIVTATAAGDITVSYR
jgi:hypothetical protein